MKISYTFLLVLGLSTLSAAIEILARDDSDGLDKHCRFSVSGQNFDLCPIFQESNRGGWRVLKEEQTPPTVTTTMYSIRVRGPILKNETIPEHEQCPPGTWICMRKYNKRPFHEDEPTRLVQVIPVAGRLSLESEGGTTTSLLNITATVAKSRQNPNHDVLRLRFHGGTYVDKPQQAEFNFICDHKAEEPTRPTHYFTWWNTHVFQWRTVHACSKSSNEADPPTNDPQEPPPLGDGTDGEQELIDLPTYRQKSTWIVVLSSIGIVGLVMYLIYWPPRLLRSRVISFLKNRPSLLRFRVGESVLVRWAQEDLELDDTGEEFVNGRREDHAFDDEEQIPLKPSPRKGPMTLGNKTYGSAL